LNRLVPDVIRVARAKRNGGIIGRIIRKNIEKKKRGVRKSMRRGSCPSNTSGRRSMCTSWKEGGEELIKVSLPESHATLP